MNYLLYCFRYQLLVFLVQLIAVFSLLSSSYAQSRQTPRSLPTPPPVEAGGQNPSQQTIDSHNAAPGTAPSEKNAGSEAGQPDDHELNAIRDGMIIQF